MKKSWKKLAALASAAILTLGMATTAFAEESGGGTSPSGSITISASSSQSDAAVSSNTYALYQVATFDVATLGSDTVYTNITAVTPFTSLQSAIEALDGESFDSTSAVSLANSAAALITSETSAKATTTSGSFTGLESGYYLIVETAHSSTDAYLSTRYILVAVEDGEESEVEIKTSTAGVTKKIISETDNSLVDADTVAIGDTVTYQLDAEIPIYASNATNLTYTLTDTMSAGLTFTGITSVQVSNDKSTWVNATSQTTNESEVKDTAGATVTISLSASDIITYSYVRVVLTATLNASAKTGETGNPNSVKLTYSNNYYGGGEGYSTPWDTVITYTGELNIVKVDAEDNTELLEGAEFEIRTNADNSSTAIGFVKESDGTYRKAVSSDSADDIVTSLVTDSNGAIKVVGLDLGTYYAVETKAPDGYSLVTTAQTLTLAVSNTDLELSTSGDATKELTSYTSNSDASTANSTAQSTYKATWEVGGSDKATIENKQGTTLPGTGGIGTTLFTFGGLALVILAAIMFIVYTKKQRKQA
ncbi:MAG: isopeptide-forming domain-containing fimbrial protein [Lachnospiraceae bacterium]|nr:isopeptide-forming domain-containing fimbrial protein [Lachnospiraceae bacterium]